MTDDDLVSRLRQYSDFNMQWGPITVSAAIATMRIAADAIERQEQLLIDRNVLLAGVTAERDQLRGEVARLRRDVEEWLCEQCRVVYPGPPQTGLRCVQCPQCKGITAPRSTVERKEAERERDQLRSEVERLRQDWSELLSQTTDTDVENRRLRAALAGLIALRDDVEQGRQRDIQISGPWADKCADAWEAAREALAGSPQQPEPPDERAWCADCGAELEAVRPRKFQHVGECTGSQVLDKYGRPMHETGEKP